MNKVIRNLLLYLVVLVVIGIGLGGSEFISALTIPGTILFASIGYPLFSKALWYVEPAVRERLVAPDPKRIDSPKPTSPGESADEDQVPMRGC